jgi:hypothetical protein
MTEPTSIPLNPDSNLKSKYPEGGPVEPSEVPGTIYPNGWDWQSLLFVLFGLLFIGFITSYAFISGTWYQAAHNVIISPEPCK